MRATRGGSCAAEGLGNGGRSGRGRTTATNSASRRCRLCPHTELRDHQIVYERRIYDFTALLIKLGVLKVKPS